MNASHPSAEAVSDLVEGLLQPDEATAVEAHLASCAECRSLRDALADVRALLADLPAPRVPADVAHRLEQALSDAASAATQGVPAGTADSPTGGRRDEPEPEATAPVPLVAGRRRRLLVGVSAAAAACLALVVGTGVLVRQVSQQGASGGSAAAERSAGDQGATDAEGPSASTFGGPTPLTSSGTTYTRRSLAADAADLLADGGGRSTQARPGAAPPTGTRLAEPDALSSCLSGLGLRRALVVDLARYEGRPAAVVVAAAPGRPGVLDVWAVGPGCSAPRPDVLARQRVPRP